MSTERLYVALTRIAAPIEHGQSCVHLTWPCGVVSGEPCDCDRDERVLRAIADAAHTGLHAVGKATEWGGFESQNWDDAFDEALERVADPGTEPQ